MDRYTECMRHHLNEALDALNSGDERKAYAQVQHALTDLNDLEFDLGITDKDDLDEMMEEPNA